MATCAICGQSCEWLEGHLLECHPEVTPQEYLDTHPGAEMISETLRGMLEVPRQRVVGHTVTMAPADAAPLQKKCLTFGYVGAPLEACLPWPASWRCPVYGDLGSDILDAGLALQDGASLFVHGMPGTGKDAFFHAYSNLTRTPAIIKSVIPGTSIQSWFYERAFNQEGTYWEEGILLKALRDGYLMPDGRRVPYIILITDFDRADREQQEFFRLLLDSISGRIEGPEGRVYPVFPGTTIVATANTSGGGDARGRMSSNTIDGSILDRFQVKVQFHDMAWRDEGRILQSKFPELFKTLPDLPPLLEALTGDIRRAVNESSLHGELSHRALCAITAHAERHYNRNLEVGVTLDGRKALLLGVRVWLDGLPDAANRAHAKGLMDKIVGSLGSRENNRRGG